MMTKLSFWVNYSFKAILYTSILSLFGSLPLSGFATAEWYAQPIWHVFTPDAFPAATPPWECTNSCKLSARTHSLIQANFLCPIHLYGMSLDCGGNRSTLRKPTQTWGHAQRTCQFHTERHPGSAGTWTRDLLTVRQQCNPPSHHPYIPLYYFT